MKFKISYSLFLVMFLGITSSLFSQDPVENEQSFEERYAQNIKKSRINGVYIPANLEEALNELQELSSEEALLKFAKGDEALVVKRLHFGLGKWMIYNWNFYEGSRISHYIKELGISHPDDQASFLITCLHRKLNGKDLDIANQVNYFHDYRKKLLQEKLDGAVLIKEETKIREKNN